MKVLHRIVYVSVTVGSLCLILPGCGSKAVHGTSGSKSIEQAKPAPPPPPATLPGEERVTETIAVAKAEPSEAARQRAEEMQQEQMATAATALQDVFFDFDSWMIREDAKETLNANARWLKTNGSRRVTIEGHCDERGTQAYNLVLGEKRAKAVRNYLVDLGLDASRFAVASYGKDRPFCREHTETCYQQNRRGHLVLRAK